MHESRMHGTVRVQAEPEAEADVEDGADEAGRVVSATAEEDGLGVEVAGDEVL